MIASKRRPHLGTKKDRATKQWLLLTSCSLPSLSETLTKILKSTSHWKPRSNKSSLPQWERHQPKHMRKDRLVRNRSKQRQSRRRTMTNLLKFAFLEIPKKEPNTSSTKHKNSMPNAAPHWHRKKINSTGYSKKNDPMETWQSALTDQSQNTRL